MRCFVINLERETGRLGWMTTAFRRMGLGFERFSAIDKTALDDDIINRLVLRNHHNWSPGEVACFMSHIAVWRRIAEGSDRHAVVLEDDVYFSRDAADFLSDDAWIPAGVDLIKLETTLNPVLVGRRGGKIKTHRLLPLYSFHNGAATYAISRRLAAQLVTQASRIDRPVDDFLFDMTRHETPCWQLSPAISIQEMFLPDQATTLPSDLEPERLATPRLPRPKVRLTRSEKAIREIRRLLWRILHFPRRAIIPMGAQDRQSGRLAEQMLG
ncbi:glycosyltransferase family 25 protein [Aminobacter sp. SR38]|jgi:glycosyl transferase family 25|uniref:glycosyltransferase family 25 protein n=1 Tax=Aminobacter sp. SR38 TaxID=2774562 RepID=UPI001781689B|nr:glycosyltransferase family 25 protein [Aminobacter sp. SR38]QOF71264.1 glycosyltransferase family 25 protein [Aminobacter sp. SR38]